MKYFFISLIILLGASNSFAQADTYQLQRTVKVSSGDVLFFPDTKTLALASANDGKMAFFSVSTGETLKQCDLNISSKDLRLSHDGNFLISDISFLPLKEVKECKGKLNFFPADGKGKNLHRPGNRYPATFISDMNSESGLFLQLNMLSSGSSPTYSASLGKINSDIKIFDFPSMSTSKINRVKESFTYNSESPPVISLDSKYLILNGEKECSTKSYPGIFSVDVKEGKVSGNLSEGYAKKCAVAFSKDRWKLGSDEETGQGLYAFSEGKKFLVSDGDAGVDSSISADGKFVAVLKQDLRTSELSVDFYCRDCR